MLFFSTFVSLAHDEHGDESDNFLLFCYTKTMDILPVTIFFPWRKAPWDGCCKSMV